MESLWCQYRSILCQGLITKTWSPQSPGLMLRVDCGIHLQPKALPPYVVSGNIKKKCPIEQGSSYMDIEKFLWKQTSSVTVLPVFGHVELCQLGSQSRFCLSLPAGSPSASQASPVPEPVEGIVLHGYVVAWRTVTTGSERLIVKYGTFSPGY